MIAKLIQRQVPLDSEVKIILKGGAGNIRRIDRNWQNSYYT